MFGRLLLPPPEYHQPLHVRERKGKSGKLRSPVVVVEQVLAERVRRWKREKEEEEKRKRRRQI